MRVAYVTNNVLPSKSPGLTFSVHTAAGLQRAGAEVSLLIRGGGGDARAVLEKDFSVREPMDLRAIRLPRLGGSNQPFYACAAAILARLRPDVAIFRNVNFMPWATVLRRLGGIRVFFEAHDFWYDPALRGEPLPPGRRRHARLERRWLHHMDGVVCVSEPQAALYRQVCPAMPVILAVTGCKPVRHAARAAPTHVIGYIGSMDLRRYPLETVMAGLATARNQRVRLLCVGARDESERQAVHEAARRHELQDRVEVLGWLHGEDLRRAEERMDVGVAILSDTFLCRIASPLKVLEYLSASLPCLTTERPGVRALLREGEHGFLARNTPQSWAEAIDRIYEQEDRLHAMGEACGRLAEALSWERRGRAILEGIAATGGQTNAAGPDGPP